MEVEACNQLAQSLIARQQYQEAVACCRQALAIEPESAEAHFSLGVAFLGLAQHEEAVAQFEAALANRPELAEAHNNLGLALLALDRCEEAAAHCQQALRLQPELAEAHNNLARALGTLGRADEAMVHCRQALSIRPDFAEAHNNLGNLQREVGDLQQAIASYERAIALAPKMAAYYRNLATSRRFAADDPYMAALEELAGEEASLTAPQQVELHFALGKMLADTGRHEASFEHYLAGNALKRQAIAYDEERRLALFDRIAAVFSGGLLRSMAGRGEPSSTPVFVLGMPRSGTTLVEQVLASHPQVHGGGELSAFRSAMDGLRLPAGGVSTFPEYVPALSDEQLRQLGAGYLATLRSLAPDAQRITDKLPANFFFVGLIHLALPNARIIHTCRDPVDTCLSCFSWLFEAGQAFTYDLGELGRYYRAYERLMAHWRRVLPAGVMLDVHYEDMVRDVEGEARRIIAHCGLEWDGACLAFYDTQRPVRTASAAQVRQPIYATSVGRWRPSEDVLRPLLEGLANGA